MVMYDPLKPEQQSAVKECVDAMMVKALEMEGTVSVSLGCLLATCITLLIRLRANTASV